MTSKGEAAISLAPLISCIDDDLEVRDALAGLLKALGFTTATFSSAESFLATGDLERTCCLITDVMLSGISGLALQARLTASGYRIPMIMITAFPDERFRAQAMGAGAVCFLNKPVTRRDLVSCIQSALHTTLPESSDE